MTLAALSPRVDIQTTIHNVAEDHRLRALFPAPFPITSASAEDTYTMVNRPARLESASTKGWVEQPVSAHPQKRFVDVSDGAHGLAILNHGLAEYEIVSRERGDAVAVTLLRSVGWLSRGDLTTRNGHAGPMLATPGGQGLGMQTAHYAILPHAGDWQSEGAVLRGGAGVRGALARAASGAARRRPSSLMELRPHHARRRRHQRDQARRVW